MIRNKCSVHLSFCSFYICFIFVNCFYQKVMTQNAVAEKVNSLCPRIFHQMFDGYAPSGGQYAGNYTEFTDARTLYPCMLSCCNLKDECNVAFVYREKCYHVKCINNQGCLPSKRTNVKDKPQMVLVNPTTDDTSWSDILKMSNLDVKDVNPSELQSEQSDPNETDELNYNYKNDYPESNKHFKEIYSEPLLSDVNRFGTDIYWGDLSDPIMMDESKYFSTISCEVGLDNLCPTHEECIPHSAKSRQGVCGCVTDYVRDANSNCIKEDRIDLASKLIKSTTLEQEPPNAKIDTSETTIKKLTVSVVSKNVRLPEKEVTLSAYTVPDEKSSGDIYKFAWSLVSQPAGYVNGTMSDQSKDNVKLSNLSEGLYRFKVIVTGTSSYGEAYTNVTVLPEKRINKAPDVNITPAQQTIKWPTSIAILDGSTSKDDDQIVSWHWDLIQGPLGYQPNLSETSTLQLTDLSSPGNYTFKLTVTDSDNEKNSTTANISVLKANDYPPEANPGPDVILFLPHNNVTLNGSTSTDDREIVAWEWTKDSNDESKAVDMQNTRTPFLQLSNLDEGNYAFVLKVTDASNQSSSARVHVFVKPPTNLPPVARAGMNATINLPQTSYTLNANESTDDIKIVQYSWVQLSGPTYSKIENSTDSMTNITDLTIGSYEYELTVTDENKKTGKDRVTVTVIQERNLAPDAYAGGDQTVTLPVNSIYLNGSKSKDDLGIVNFLWTRESSSLAIGTIVGDTDHEPVLILANIVPGRYVFKLTVTDAQGLTGTDTVSVIVHQDPYILNLVELTFTIGVTILTKTEIDSLQQKLLLLLGDNTKLLIRDLRMEQKTGEAVLIFCVEKTTDDGQSQMMPGPEVAKLLNNKFWRDIGILGTSISDVRTTICQNTCSGHGICNTATRACMCETFWMPDIFYFYGISEANCYWSILYVVIGVFIGFFFVSGLCWGLTCLCKNRSRKPKSRVKTQKYSLLGTHDDESLAHNHGNSLSDSDTDSDVLFENRTKQNGALRSNGTVKNGQKSARLGRRIKT